MIFAGTAMSIVPVLIVFLALQKYFMAQVGMEFVKKDESCTLSGQRDTSFFGMRRDL
jgi:hypothetical protein